MKELFTIQCVAYILLTVRSPFLLPCQLARTRLSANPRDVCLLPLMNHAKEANIRERGFGVPHQILYKSLQEVLRFLRFLSYPV